MLDASPKYDRLPAAPGVGYKAQHFADIMADAGPVEWLEVHAENYMGDGGRPIAQLDSAKVVRLCNRVALKLSGCATGQC